MVCKNTDYKENTVDIYVIKSFLNDYFAFHKSIIDSDPSKIGGISGNDKPYWVLDKDSAQSGFYVEHVCSENDEDLSEY